MVRRLSIASALLIVSIAGCNSIAGINDPIDQNAGSSGTSGTSGAPGGVQRFLGRWTTTNATVRLTNCPVAETLVNQQLAVVFRQGPTSTTLLAGGDDATGCQIPLSVAGDVATLAQEQSCFSPNPNGQSVELTYTAPTTFTLSSADGRQAIMQLTANAFFTPAGVACDYDEKSTYTKE
jgi:hypothetical protein